MDLDIISHSRGGLLARSLVKQGSQAPIPIKIGKAVLAATPNQGTALADAAHMRDVLNIWTNIIESVLPGTLKVVADVIFTLVKVMGYAGLKSLPGLSCMSPNSAYLGALLQPTASSTPLYAIASDFEETLGGALSTPIQWAAYEADQEIFANAKNDLVVPYLGAVNCSGDGNFPIPAGRTLLYPANAQVYHTNLFAQALTLSTLQAWL